MPGHPKVGSKNPEAGQVMPEAAQRQEQPFSRRHHLLRTALVRHPSQALGEILEQALVWRVRQRARQAQPETELQPGDRAESSPCATQG
jgi:hypothetical protein